MGLSFSRLVPRALAGGSAALLLAFGVGSMPAFAAGEGNAGGSGAATPSHTSSNQSSAGHQSGPPADAAEAQRQSTAAGSPPSGFNGNKGHIQIEGAPDCGATPCGNDNDPHVGCTLTVQFFGYPAGTDRAGVVIAGQPPSGWATVLTDSFSFPGNSSPQGSILDFSKSYSITTTQLARKGLTPQRNQGYHLRVDASVNGHHAKSKVIWYGCVTPAGVAGSATQTSGTPSAVPSSRSGTFTPAVGDTPDLSALSPSRALDTPGTPDTPDTPAVTHSLLGDTQAVATAAVKARASHSSSGFLAFTGWKLALALAVAAASLAGGFAFVRLSHRKGRLAPVG